MSLKLLALAFALAAVAPIVGASLTESTLVTVQQAVSDVAGTPVECVQNDGSSADGEECDAADTCDGAYQTLSTAPGERTGGNLVPVDDEADYFLGDMSAYQGARVRLSVAGFEMQYAVGLFDNTCGVLADGAGAAPTAGTAADVKPLFSGLRPFQPISVDQVLLAGVPATSFSGTGSYATIDFRVINQPKHLTFDDVPYTIAVGSSVRLCAFTGDLQLTVGSGGGNIKFDGVGSAVRFSTNGEPFAACPPPREPDANPVCAEHWCDFTVNSVTQHVRFGVRYLGPSDPTQPVAVPANCHDGCLNLLYDAPLPNSYTVGFTRFT